MLAEDQAGRAAPAVAPSVTVLSSPSPPASEDDRAGSGSTGWMSARAAAAPAPRASRAAKTAPKKTSRRATLDDDDEEDEEEEEDYGQDSSEDEEGTSATLDDQLAVVDFVNSATRRTLSNVPRCTKHVALAIMSLRPFADWDDLVCLL